MNGGKGLVVASPKRNSEHQAEPVEMLQDMFGADQLIII